VWLFGFGPLQRKESPSELVENESNVFRKSMKRRKKIMKNYDHAGHLGRKSLKRNPPVGNFIGMDIPLLLHESPSNCMKKNKNAE